MSTDIDQNTHSTRSMNPVQRRVWQPPQAKAVDVAAVTRNTTISIYADGATTCSS